MCGITGLFYPLKNKQASTSSLKIMNDAIKHRGPDGEGFYFDSNHHLGFGHRRLSIIDIEGGSQPMISNDQSIITVFNGEIYNYHDLKNILETLGHRFQTNSDTEILLYGWKEWGEKLPNYLRGMFAFAIWDQTEKTLFLARDRVGKKPLYYARLEDNGFAFASELKAIETLPAFSKKIDPTAIEDFFAYGYIPDPKSIYENCFKLEAGHSMLLKTDSLEAKINQYWDMSYTPPSQADEKTLRNELIHELTQSIRLRQISDVPIGAFLSGGVDSSAVVALMSCLHDDPINTFSIGFDEAAFDESDYAERVAKKYKTNHHHQMVDADDFSLVSKMIDIYDEPYGDSSALPTYQLSQMTAKKLKVALSGDGGDELFAGYRRYLWHIKEEKVRDFLPSWLRRNLFSTLGHLYPKLDWAPRFLRAKNTFQELACDSADGFFMSISCMNDFERDQLFSDEFKHQLKGYHPANHIHKYYDKAPTDNGLQKVQYVDLKTWLPGDILTKVDRASMASSLEVRAPMLDHKFIEWSGTLSDEAKIKGNEGKYILKKSMGKFLPEDILYRPKMGFSVPLANWFRGPLKEDITKRLTTGVLADSHYFQQSQIKRYLKEHFSGRRDHSRTLWLLTIFQSFLEKGASS